MIVQQSKKELRQFGLVVGGVFLGIGLWPWVWQETDPRLWALAIGVALGVLGVVSPNALKHVHKGWMAVGHVMGWINTRIILGFFFYVVLTPMGLIACLAGKDFMQMKPGARVDTYRVLRAPRVSTHFRQQF